MAKLRFVIQEHSKRKTRHFDLMLESRPTGRSYGRASGVLKTWSFAKPLKDYTSNPVVINVTALPDHRLIYLTYEGKISRGRGSVRIWDKGVYEIVSWGDNRKIVRVQGGRITGYLVILSLPPLLPPRLIPLIHFR